MASQRLPPAGVIMPPIVRIAADPARANPSVSAVEIYITGREVTGHATTETALIRRLARLSAADCMLWIAHLQTRLFSRARPEESAAVQRLLVEETMGGTSTGTAVLEQ